jgi:hypothetical protein
MAEKLDQEETVLYKELLIMAMIETQAITQLLIEKGIITKEEYFAKLKDVQRQYEERQKNVVV